MDDMSSFMSTTRASSCCLCSCSAISRSAICSAISSRGLRAPSHRLTSLFFPNSGRSAVASCATGSPRPSPLRPHHQLRCEATSTTPPSPSTLAAPISPAPSRSLAAASLPSTVRLCPHLASSTTPLDSPRLHGPRQQSQVAMRIFPESGHRTGRHGVGGLTGRVGSDPTWRLTCETQLSEIPSSSLIRSFWAWCYILPEWLWCSGQISDKCGFVRQVARKVWFSEI
ncbi:hypothetical protein BRADI_2g52865v3 [Brachypodium distachyon]|uniref:Uncharacterized protein n=1 Tax=Brachypodium distachyon TaxID=15368 RepID=A0A0Q3GGP4_BRADI|nr:hypothetical protein BRADI_2g52865v3 [Brachypodium distachyon]